MAKQVYVFSAQLDGWKGVRRTIAIRGDQTLVDLHGALQAAFSWDNDVPSAQARTLGELLLTRAMAQCPSLRMDSYDRLFQSQDTMPAGRFGNLIAPSRGAGRAALESQIRSVSDVEIVTQ